MIDKVVGDIKLTEDIRKELKIVEKLIKRKFFLTPIATTNAGKSTCMKFLTKIPLFNVSQNLETSAQWVF
jgi:hypothetical protein